MANYLIGRVTANTTLSAIQYSVLGVVFVNSGVTLTIPAGATLRFYINSPLIADGTLAVQGASGNLVTFTSAAAAPAAGNWTGIVVRASGSSIEYAKIEYATTAVNLTGASGTVRNNLIGRFVNNGIYLSGTAAAAGIVQGNTVDNLNDTGDCIEANALSAAITGNTLSNCLKGVSITGGGNGTAVNANVITGNDYGMFVDGANSTSPAPVATGNQLYSNDLYDYYTEQYPSGGANIRLNATGNWWGSIAPAAISSKIFDQNDSSTLPIVDYSGFLDAANGAPVAGNQLIGRVLATTSLVAGQTYDVLGMLTVAAGVTLTVSEGTVLKFHSPATRLIVEGTLNVQSMTWDGRTAGGAYVADEAYSFALHATDGTRSANYDPPLTGGPTGSGTGSVDTSFNANKNDFWKMNYTMNHYGRIRMQVSGCTTPTHFPYNWVPYPPGVHPLKWDGRGSDGQVVSGSCSIYFDAPLYMKANSVIVRGTTPMITGTASPNVEVKSNPYRVFHSYEQFSRITYRLDQDSYVTVKLLPPGVSDPASPQAIVITNNELRAAQGGGQPVDHVFEWKGYEDTDTNNILVSAEGSYTFTIQATSVVSGATSLYRGVLQLWQ